MRTLSTIALVSALAMSTSAFAQYVSSPGAVKATPSLATQAGYVTSHKWRHSHWKRQHDEAFEGNVNAVAPRPIASPGFTHPMGYDPLMGGESANGG
jgi:hypothetical protein